MWKKLKIILLIFSLIIALAVIGFISLYSFTSVVDRNVLSLVNRLAGDDVHVHFSDMSGNLMRQLRLSDVEVVFKGDTLLETPRIQFEYRILDIIRQRYHLHDLQINSPRVAWKFSGAPPDTTTNPLDTFFDVLGAAPEVRLDRLAIADGQFKWISSTNADSITGINLELSSAISDSQLYLQPERVAAEWGSENLQLEDLRFRLNGTKEVIVLQDFFAQIPGASLSGDGRLKRFPEPNLLLQIDKSRFDITLVKMFVDSLPIDTGYVEIAGMLEGNVRSFEGRLIASGQLDSLKINSLESGFERDYSWFNLRGLEVVSSAGSLQGDLDISRRKGLRSDLSFNDLALQKTGFLNIPLTINGSLEAQSNSLDFLLATGEARISLQDPAFANLKAEQIDAVVNLEKGNVSLGENTRIVFSDSAIVQVQGAVSADSLDATLSSESFALRPLLEGLSLRRITGQGSLDLSLSGKTADPDLEGYVFLDSLLYNAITVYGIDGDVSIDSLFSKPTGRASLELATGFVSDIFLTHGSFEGRFRGSDIMIDSLKFLSKDNAIIVGGIVDIASDSTLIDLPRLDFQLQNFALGATDPVKLKWARDTLFVNALNLQNQAQTGLVTGSGFWCFDSSNTIFNAQLIDIPIDPFNDYHYLRYALNGTVDSDIEIYGLIDSLEILSGLELKELFLVDRDSVIAPQPLGTLQSEVLYAANRLGINFLNYEQDDNSFLTLNGAVDFTMQGGDSLVTTPLDMNLIAEGLLLERYRPFLRTNFPLEGSVSGRAELKGTTANPELYMTLSGDSLRYAEYRMPELRFVLNGDSSGIVLDSGYANYINTDINFVGTKNLSWEPGNIESLFADSTFELVATIREDSLNFLNSINPELDIITGDIRADITLGGTFQVPQVKDAELSLKDGKLYLARLQNSIDNVELSANLASENVLSFNVVGESVRPENRGNFLQRWFSGIWSTIDSDDVGGKLKASGTADLTDVLRPRVDVSVNADRVYLNYFLENARLIVSTDNLSITGKDTLLITGDVGVGGGVNFDFVESEKNLLLAPAVRQEAPFFRYRINVDLLPGFYIRNEDNFNNFDFQVNGTLAVLLEPRQVMEYRGTLDVDGKYLIQGEVFGIRDGQIKFVNPKEELPELDIAASKRKSNYTFELKIDGPLDNPQKDITVIDKNGNALTNMDTKDEMALLLFGVTFSELGSGTDSLLLLKGEELLAQTVLSILERETRSYTGLDQVRLDGQSSYFESELNKKNTPTLSLGKYLTPNLYLEYRSALESSGFGNIPRPSLAWEEGNQIYLQYRLNRNWSFSTSYETTQEGNEKVKLDISWRVEF